MTGLNSIGICKGVKCGKRRIIVNKRHGLCQECNYIRLHGNKPGKTPIKHKRYNEKFAYCTEWGFTSEMPMFEAVLDQYGSKSMLSGLPISSPGPVNFAHLLAKGINKYPHFKLNPHNVWLMTQMEHHLLDNGSAQQRQDYAENLKRPALWTDLYIQVATLKDLYKLKFGS